MAILTVYGSNAGIETQNHIKSVLGIYVPVYYFEKVKNKKHLADVSHDSGRNHISLAKYANKSNKKYSLIFEDDARFYSDRDSKKIFFQTINDLRSINFDVIHLGSEPLLPLFKIKNNIYRSLFGVDVHSTIYSKKGRDKLISIEHKIPKNSSYDYLKYSNGTLNQIDFRFIPIMKCFTIYPPICYQYKCPSAHMYKCNHATILDITNSFQVYAKYLYLVQIITIIILVCYKKKIKKIVSIFIIINVLLLIILYVLPIYKF